MNPIIYWKIVLKCTNCTLYMSWKRKSLNLLTKLHPSWENPIELPTTILSAFPGTIFFCKNLDWGATFIRENIHVVLSLLFGSFQAWRLGYGTHIQSWPTMWLLVFILAWRHYVFLLTVIYSSVIVPRYCKRKAKCIWHVCLQ